MDALNQITAECFNAIAQLREVEGPSRSPDLVHRRIRDYVDAMRARAREQGVAQRDADDIAYAIVALIDEVALGRPEPLGSFWMSQPLQLEYFNENLAGEGFFTRLDEIRKHGRRTDVLRVYYQCLLLGFQGKYSIRGGDLELMRIIDAVRPEIERQMDPVDGLSPAADPPDEPLVRASQRNPFLWVALGLFALAIAVFVGLKVSLDRHVSDLGDRVEELNR
jgi:type VI secretion system protein ImpK